MRIWGLLLSSVYITLHYDLYFLKSRGYKEALIFEMNYKLVFRITGHIVYIVGLFHNLEDYTSKIFDKVEQGGVPPVQLTR